MCTHAFTFEHAPITRDKYDLYDLQTKDSCTQR